MPAVLRSALEPSEVSRQPLLKALYICAALPSSLPLLQDLCRSVHRLTQVSALCLKLRQEHRVPPVVWTLQSLKASLQGHCAVLPCPCSRVYLQGRGGQKARARNTEH